VFVSENKYDDDDDDDDDDDVLFKTASSTRFNSTHISPAHFSTYDMAFIFVKSLYADFSVSPKSKSLEQTLKSCHISSLRVLSFHGGPIVQTANGL